MTGPRANKTEEGSHEYILGTLAGVEYTACLMGNDEWFIFAGKGDGTWTDAGKEFKTLAAARKWFGGLS